MSNWFQNQNLTAFTRVVVLIALYFIGGLVGKETTFLSGSVALVWPPAGIALATILLFGYATSVRLRIGICTGPVVAGVIGRRIFAYDLWGETVNLACRMESTGEAGKIQIAESTYERLKDKYQFETKHRLDVKGPDPLSAYWLGKRRNEKMINEISAPYPAPRG